MKLGMRLLTVARLVLLGAAVVCSGPIFAVGSKSTVGVSVHGVDYSGSDFSYYIAPEYDPGKTGTGELINAYSAGGTVCCVTLPRKWQPGIKLQVRTTHWLPKVAGEPLPEIKDVAVIELPQYPSDGPGELWVLRTADGKIDIVASNLQPDHADWPGAVKGWPVPSVEYRRKRWEVYRKREEGNVKLYKDFVKEMSTAPRERAAKTWNFAVKEDQDSLVGFRGPDDPRYIESLAARYNAGLLRSEDSLRRLMESRP